MSRIEWFQLLAMLNIACGLFSLCDSMMSSEEREELSDRVSLFAKSGTVSGAPLLVAYTFHSLFGGRVLSRRFFFISLGSSIVSSIAVASIYLMLHPQTIGSLNGAGDRARALLGFFALLPALNFVADYFSNIETRWMLGWVTEKTSAKLFAVIVVLDAILTTLIHVVFSAVLFTALWCAVGGSFERGIIGQYIVPSYKETMRGLGGLYATAANPKDGRLQSFNISLYTTYLTSIWIWVYIAAVVVIGSVRGLAGASLLPGPIRSLVTRRPLVGLHLLSSAIVSLVCLLGWALAGE